MKAVATDRNDLPVPSDLPILLKKQDGNLYWKSCRLDCILYGPLLP
jgi:hypothetical protein